MFCRTRMIFFEIGLIVRQRYILFFICIFSKNGFLWQRDGSQRVLVREPSTRYKFLKFKYSEKVLRFLCFWCWNSNCQHFGIFTRRTVLLQVLVRLHMFTRTRSAFYYSSNFRSKYICYKKYINTSYIYI